METITIENFVSFVEIHRYAGYFILFLAMVLEGETILIISGILASLNAFDIGDVIWISFGGVVLGNMLWYYIGFKVSHRAFAQKIILRADKAVKYFLPHFHQKPFKSIFFSKFIYGVNRATVFMSGVFKIKFRLFMEAEVLASVVWVLLYAAVGYFFGYAAIQITKNVALLALLAVLFVVGFILLKKTFAHYYVRREHKKEKDSNP